MNATFLLQQLQATGLRLHLDSEGMLHVTSTTGHVPEGAMQMIAEHRDELAGLVRYESTEPEGDDLESKLDIMRREHLRLFLAGQVPACRELEQKIERLEAELAFLRRSGPEASQAGQKLDGGSNP